ncbi:MAG: ribose 5-phosphate isomerase B [Bacillales bacterium]|nr:ribose 5-phosphate isomerase B [Bacillales bacterium]
MKISIGSDHGGFALKEALINHLKDENEIIDEGCFNTDSVDYPLYAEVVSKDVVLNKADLGILICTNGIGMSIAANKFKGIRAALVLNEDMASHARLHNDANILCLGAQNQTIKDAIKISDIFIKTEFSNVERHKRRVEEIESFEGGK